MRSLVTWLLLFALSATAAAAGDVTVYQCSDARGQVTYQGQPCANDQQQKVLQLPGSAAAPAPRLAAPATPTEPRPEPAPASAPGQALTRLYRCVHAVDGKEYVSRNGHPQPFLAPLGMLGALPTSLSDTYGAPGGAGISAPQVHHGRVSSALVANNYVWVRDQCRPMSVPEICHELRKQYEQNEHKLRGAFRSDKPPLQQREEALAAQLTNC